MLEIKTKNLHLKFGKSEESKPVESNIQMPKKEYTYAPLRTALLPTPAELRQAVITIDLDPRPMMDILRRLPSADSHIFSVGNTRQLAILGYDWKLNPTDDNDEERKKCDELINQLNKGDFNKALTGITNGVLYGHAVIKPRWMLDNNNQYYPQFDFLEGIHFGKKDGKVKMIVDKNDKDFMMQIGDNIRGVVSVHDVTSVASRISSAGSLMWLDLDEENLIVVNSIPPILTGWSNNYVGGLMRTGLYLSLLKYYNVLDWAKFNELYGMPIRIGKFDNLLSGKAAIDILKTAVQNLGTDAAAVIDKTTEIELKETTSPARSNTFGDFAEYVERKQSLQFIGQNLTAEVLGKYTSRAAAQTQNLVRMDYMWADLQLVTPNVQKIIDKLYFYNYGYPKNGVYPKFEFYTEEAKDLTLMSGVVDDLTRAGLEVSKDWAYKFFGIKPPINEPDSFGAKNANPFNLAD